MFSQTHLYPSSPSSPDFQVMVTVVSLSMVLNRPSSRMRRLVFPTWNLTVLYPETWWLSYLSQEINIIIMAWNEKDGFFGLTSWRPLPTCLPGAVNFLCNGVAMRVQGNSWFDGLVILVMRVQSNTWDVIFFINEWRISIQKAIHWPQTVIDTPTAFSRVIWSPKNQLEAKIVETSFAMPAIDIGTTPALWIMLGVWLSVSIDRQRKRWTH